MLRRVGTSGAAACVFFLIAGGPAAAAPKPITGKLSASGYSVLALAPDGRATSVPAEDGSFGLSPPARRVTLHLRDVNGVYGGPIVVGRRRGGTRAILGVRAGTKLGEIRVRRAKGYARPASRPARRRIAARIRARARRGVPVGAGKFGLVRSRNARGISGDRDLDGIPDPLDIDDDGDRVLDNLERPTAARAAQAGGELAMSPILPVTIDATANANAAGLAPGQSDAILSSVGWLGMTSPVDAPELDCGGSRNLAPPPPWAGGLGYCTPGGTGGVFGTLPELEFPECCDDDGDGLGAVVHVVDPDGDGIGTPVPAQAGPAGGFALHHHATTTEIRTGDVLIERATIGGVEMAFPATLQYVFATVPALVSYRDTAGNSATVEYPVHGPIPGPADAGPGAHGNGFPLAPGPDGHIRITLTFWRPQRRSSPADPGTDEWIDIGGLTYALTFRGRNCGPQSAFSTSDPSLGPPPPGIPGFDPSGVPGGGFTDLAPDRPADPANTLSFALDLTQCLESRGLSFAPGEEEFINLNAIAGNGGDTAQQWFAVERR
jgi:hypothetical protein